MALHGHRKRGKKLGKATGEKSGRMSDAERKKAAKMVRKRRKK